MTGPSFLPAFHGFHASAAEGAVKAAQLRIMRVMDGWGVPLTAESRSDLALLSSELVTNALAAPEAACEIAVGWDGRLVRVQATGEDLAGRAMTRTGPSGGPGLFLVKALASGWGTSSAPSGESVWFEVCPATVRPSSERLSVLVRVVTRLLGLGPSGGEAGACPAVTGQRLRPGAGGDARKCDTHGGTLHWW